MAKASSKQHQTFRQSFRTKRDQIWEKRSQRVRLHQSFKRSYREDYERPLNAPGVLSFAMTTLGFILKRWKLFGSLLLVVVGLNILLVGIMQESTYTDFQETLEDANASLSEGELGAVAKAGLLLVTTITTGGLNQGMGEVQQIFAILLFIVVWLVTIYFIRHIIAGNNPRFRDGLYNALSPFISSLLVFLIVFIHLIPIFLVIITYSAAVATEFLTTPLYAFIYWLLAAGLILLSCYLLPGSLLGLVAVSAPGMYPMAAVNTASDLMAGRRVRFIIRLIFALFFLAVIWIIVMMPIILLDFWIKGAVSWTSGWPIVPLFLLLMTCFTFIYMSAYLYLFYRKMLDDPN